MGVNGTIPASPGLAIQTRNSTGTPMYQQVYKSSANTELWLDGTPLEMHVTGYCTAVTTASTKWFGWSEEQSSDSADFPSTMPGYPQRTQATTGAQKIICAVAGGGNYGKQMPLKAATTCKVGDTVGWFTTTDSDGKKQFYADPGATNKTMQVIAIDEVNIDTANMPNAISGSFVDVAPLASTSQWEPGQATLTNP